MPTASAQAAERAAAGWVELDLVFTRPNGTFVHPDIYSQTFRRAVRRLGLPYIRLHDIRHTARDTRAGGGHTGEGDVDAARPRATTASTQDVYMQSVPSPEENAADQIADLIFGSDGDDDAAD